MTQEEKEELIKADMRSIENGVRHAFNQGYDLGYKNGLQKIKKIGYWEYVQYDSNPDIGNWHCSECRNIIIECFHNAKKDNIPTFNYCPNCGRKMYETIELCKIENEE